MSPRRVHHRVETAAFAVNVNEEDLVMTHHVLEELAAQRQSQLATRAAQERHAAATRPTPSTARRTRRVRPFSALVALVSRA
jgi:hypothetical protein